LKYWVEPYSQTFFRIKKIFFADCSSFKNRSPFENAIPFKNSSSFFTSVHQAIRDKDIIINRSQQKATGYGKVSPEKQLERKGVL